MRIRFCLVCGTEFHLAGFEWLGDDEPATCRNCGAEIWPLEQLSLAERRRVEQAYKVDTAQTLAVQGRFL